MGAATGEQTHARFQDDGADANTSTLLGTEDVRNTSLLLDTTYFARIKLKVLGMNFNNHNVRLEYNVAGAGWNQVSTTSLNVRLVDGGDTDGDSMSTERLANDGGTYNAGLYEETGDTAAHDILIGETEYVYAIQFRSADLTSGEENIDLRLTNASALYTTYTVNGEAQMPVISGGLSIPVAFDHLAMGHQ